MSQDHTNMPGMKHPAKPEAEQPSAKPQKPKRAEPKPTTGKS